MSLSCSSSMLSGSSWFCAFVFINYFLTKRLLEGKCWPFLPSSCGGHVLSVILHFCLLAFLLSCSFVFFSFAFLFWLFLFSFLCGVCVWRIVFYCHLAPCLDTQNSCDDFTSSVVVVERSCLKIRIRRIVLLNSGLYSSYTVRVIPAICIRKKRFPVVRQVRLNYYRSLQNRRVVKRCLRVQSNLSFVITSFLLSNSLQFCLHTNFEHECGNEVPVYVDSDGEDLEDGHEGRIDREYQQVQMEKSM